jgi:hypothetical protein
VLPPLETLVPLQAIYGNLLSDALVGLGTRIAFALRQRIGDRDLETRLSAPTVRDAISRELAKRNDVERVSAEIGGERLREFFSSAEVNDMACQVFAAQLARRPKEAEEKLRRRFLATFSWFVAIPEQELRHHSDRLLDGLLVAAKAALRELNRAGDTEAERLLGEQLVKRSVPALDRALAALAAGPPDLEATFEFEAHYRRAAAVRHRRIEPPNYDGERTLTVEDLYVEPFFEVRNPSGGSTERISAERVVTAIDRTVVLGDPGAGKSTFASTLVYRFVSESHPWRVSRWEPTPFLIVLRDYASRKRQRPTSILEFAEQLCASSYQVAPPPKSLEYIFASGRALVIFDGLDELINTRDRKEIRSDVEAFCTRYPATRVLVTSRVVGYGEAPLERKVFSTARVANFAPDDVNDFATRWFALDERHSPDEQKVRAQSFIRESASVSDLRSNPLLLSLMCVIYRRQNFIPRARTSVYHECAEMLFDRWDRGRQIIDRRPLEAHLRSALQHIAHWIYRDPLLLSGVRHEHLVDHTMEYVLTEVIDDRATARRVSEDFVRFCHGRAWVLVETGTTDDGYRLYGFAHRTFLEFFTAEWLAAHVQSLEELTRVLLPRVERGEWEMVALLTTQIRNESVHGTGNEIVSQVVKRAETSVGRNRINLLGFATRTLEFLVPRPTITRELAQACFAMHHDAITTDSKRMIGQDQQTREVLRRLALADEDALRSVRQAVGPWLETNPDPRAAADVREELRMRR